MPPGRLVSVDITQVSERETMAAIAEVRRHYNIDPARMYLTGNSMGGIGTQYLAAKYPDMWAAIAPAGGIAPWSYPYGRLRDFRVAVLYVHGERDEHAHWRWSKALAGAARANGVDATLLMVPGARYGQAWIDALPRTFDFLLRHRRHRDNAE